MDKKMEIFLYVLFISFSMVGFYFNVKADGNEITQIKGLAFAIIGLQFLILGGGLRKNGL